MKQVQLTQGKVALVSDSDWALVCKYKWHAHKGSHKTWYATFCQRYGSGGKLKRFIRMHRLIKDAPKNLEVDHRNGDGLDNRRSNLRLATHKQNSHNKTKHKDNASGFKGVSWDKRNSRWVVSIMVDGVYYFLGRFGSKINAAAAYAKAAHRLHGRFAKI